MIVRRYGVRAAWILLAWLVAGIVAARVLLLAATGVGLHPDEAQYWSWSLEPAWGYFTKPPMIAWIISATGSLCGDAEWCVRLASPVMHGGTSLLVALIAARLFGGTAAVWAGLLFLTLPGVSWSSVIMSTDVPLLLCWAGALYCLLRLLDREGFAWACGLGLALGLGLLAKYAMAYLLPCLVLACLAYREHRWFLVSGRFLVALLVAGTVVAPNVAWNMDNGWATVGHVGDNASLSGPAFNLENLLEFLAGQAGVFGPILFAVLAWRTLLLLRGRTSRAEGFLLCFSVPVLAVVCVQALLSRANANWAAPAFVAGSVAVTGWAVEAARRRLLAWSLGLHLAAAGVLAVLLLEPVNVVGDPFRRMRAWDETARHVSGAMHANPGRILLTDDRKTMASLLYYGRDDGLDPRMWDYDGNPDHHYELANRYRPHPGDRVLLAARWDGHGVILDAFDEVRPIGVMRIRLGQGRERVLHLFALDVAPAS